MHAQVAGHLGQVFHRLVCENLTSIADERKSLLEARVGKDGIESRLPVRKGERICSGQIYQRLATVDSVLKWHDGHGAGLRSPPNRRIITISTRVVLLFGRALRNPVY
jgi:hypothetical protein